MMGRFKVVTDHKWQTQYRAANIRCPDCKHNALLIRAVDEAIADYIECSWCGEEWRVRGYGRWARL